MPWSRAWRTAGTTARNGARRPPHPWLATIAGRSALPKRHAASRASGAITSKRSPVASNSLSRGVCAKRGGVAKSREAASTARLGATTEATRRCMRCHARAIWLRTFVLFRDAAADMAIPSETLGTVGFDQAIEGVARELVAFFFAARRRDAIAGEHDGYQLVCHLARIGLLPELARIDGELDRPRELAIELVLARHRGLAHRTGRVHVFTRGLVHRATAWEVRALRPADPVLEQHPQALHATRGLQRRPEDLIGEHARRLFERCELEILLRPEMREEPALGQARLLGERADGERFEPATARLLHGGGEDLGAGFLSLGRRLQ